MLLLLESVPVAGDDAYERCWVHVLDSYLEDATKDFRPPRFLLNDLVRYWRTICVDFVGKQREDEEKWGLRNAKLRTGRKVLFAAGLLPILLCDRHQQAAMRPFLVEQLRAPATDRLAAAFAAYDLVDSGGRALDAYDRWIGMLGDDATRAELAAVRRETRGRFGRLRAGPAVRARARGGPAGAAVRDPARRARARVRCLLSGSNSAAICNRDPACLKPR